MSPNADRMNAQKKKKATMRSLMAFLETVFSKAYSRIALKGRRQYQITRAKYRAIVIRLKICSRIRFFLLRLPSINKPVHARRFGECVICDDLKAKIKRFQPYQT